MNKWLILTVGLALGMMVLIPGVVGMAGEAEPVSFHDKTQSSNITFSSVDAGIRTEVRISAADNLTHEVEEGEPSIMSSSFLEVNILQNTDGCVPLTEGCDPPSINAGGINVSLADGDFLAPSVSPGAIWRLNTAITVFSRPPGSQFDLIIDLELRCIEAVVREVQHPEPEPGNSGGVEKGNLRRADCMAEAMGSVSTDSTNLTPEPSAEAFMQSEILTEIEVSHP